MHSIIRTAETRCLYALSPTGCKHFAHRRLKALVGEVCGIRKPKVIHRKIQDEPTNKPCAAAMDPGLNAFGTFYNGN
ncbi:unnamed protein product, partial [Chrysoparadoxa australica]